MPSISKDHHHDIPGYRLEAGGFSAFICPSMGANCIQLCSGQASYLRTPESYSALREDPNLYGMPVLFPPNRIKNGVYFFNHTEYRFPINEPSRGHHIHGFLSSTAFKLISEKVTEDRAILSLSCQATKKNPYLSFPHSFELTVTFILDDFGLTHELMLKNTSETVMPFGLGLHTTFNDTFLSQTSPEEYVLRIAVSEEIEFDRSSIIPTGNMSHTELAKNLEAGLIHPQQYHLSNLFTARQNKNGACAVYSHTPTKTTIQYHIEDPYRYWMLFNGKPSDRFLCIEPQSWIIDAPNSALPPEDTGFRTLVPGATTTLVSYLGLQ